MLKFFFLRELDSSKPFTRFHSHSCFVRVQSQREPSILKPQKHSEIILNMEKIVKVFEDMNRKAETLQEAMIVMPHQYKVNQEMHDLNGELDAVDKLQAEVKKKMQEHEAHLKKEYESLMASIGRNQQKMMLLLEHMDENEESKLKVPTQADEGASPQPKLSLAEFSVSPLSQKKLKKRLQFSDFEAEITPDEFAKIPDYIKGRTKLEALVEFLEKAILSTFNDKYQIVHHKKSALNAPNLQLQNEFKVQSKLFEGEKFISADDVVRVFGRSLTRNEEKSIQMLRHLHIIRESRKGPSVYYVWQKK